MFKTLLGLKSHYYYFASFSNPYPLIMKFRFLIFAFVASIISISSCTNKEEKAKKVEADKKVRVKEDDKADSLLIAYNPQKEISIGVISFAANDVSYRYIPYLALHL